MSRMSCALAMLTVCLFPGEALTATIRVPADQPTIQAAVNAAGVGDVVVVSGGTYTEQVLVSAKTNLTIRPKGSAKVIIDAGGSGYPLNITGSANVTIKKIRVRNTTNRDGIRVHDSTAVVLNACRAEGYNSSGILVLDSSTVQVLKCRITGTGGADGITLVNTDGSLVEQCKINDAGNDGINVSGAMNVIRKNRVNDAGIHGIRLGESSACLETLVIGNVIKDSLLDGIFCGASADNCSLFSNKITGGSDGIDLDTGSDGHILFDNTVKSPGSSGIETSSDNHLLLGNRVKKSAAQAYYILALADGCLLQGNSSKKAGTDGFYAGGIGNTFHKNTARKSGSFDLNDPNTAGANDYVDNDFGTVAP